LLNIQSNKTIIAFNLDEYLNCQHSESCFYLSRFSEKRTYLCL